MTSSLSIKLLLSVVAIMASSSLDMLKKLSAGIQQNSSPKLLKRKQQDSPNGRQSPIIARSSSIVPKKINFNQEPAQKKSFSNKNQVTSVDLTSVQQEMAAKHKKRVLEAKLIVQQAEEEDFRTNHAMLDEKYEELYSRKNIEKYIKQWKISALKNYQDKMTLKKQGKYFLFIVFFVSDSIAMDPNKKLAFSGCSKELLFQYIPVANKVCEEYKEKQMRRFPKRLRDQMENNQIPNYKMQDAVSSF